MLIKGTITQDEALANADSATNLLWLINNTEAGGSLYSGETDGERRAEIKPPQDSSFSSFKLDISEA